MVAIFEEKQVAENKAVSGRTFRYTNSLKLGFKSNNDLVVQAIIKVNGNFHSR